MSFTDPDAALQAVRADYEARPPLAQACQLGDLMILKPDGARPDPGLLWIMGFNGGETEGAKDGAGDTQSARKWFKLCGEAASAVGSPAYIIGERTHWGSPTVRDLVQRVGSAERFRALLKLHAAANLALLHAYRPRVVWMTGLSSYATEAVEDYGLMPKGEPAPRDKRGRLWQEYVGADGVPWLATIHPTGARISAGEFQRVKAKLAALSAGLP
ncbi:hypothetical protein [Caulobacter sp. S45]|uniref:hypothetical protein n=1 Tax=Caulobacter sp. S45 TaxID=1641861 RepID=UPI00131D58F9|nr:hypothetical protein [Caulobacter sp. S45]